MKKNVCIIVLMLLSLSTAFTQVHIPNRAVLLSNDFNPGKGQLTISSVNEDYCDYYVQITFLEVNGFEGMSYNQGISVLVGRGNQQVRLYKARTGATSFSYRYRYDTYRGNCAKSPDTNFVYALPAKNKDTVTAVILGMPEYRQIVFDLPSDTLYACRSGVMCDDNLRDQTGRTFNPSGLAQITLYHEDSSFSGYNFQGKLLIAPGDKVKMGDPIALVDRNIDKYTVNFSAYFLDKNKMTNTFKNKHTHFLPIFQTAEEGQAQLKSMETYTCKLTDEIRMQGMSKSEKKKFLKADK